MTAALAPVRARLGGWLSGLGAIGVKELRGRMRGRRAFVVLTVYLIFLGGYAWMTQLTQLAQYENQYAGQAAFASAAIGRGIFGALVLLETLLVVVLVPAFTAGAISMEREKQTLDMLATTPLPSLAIVVGKLLSALVYVFILVLASIPLSALVFVFGGVAPDDVLRAYVVLLATAFGLGSMALFFSALVRRTQAATIMSYVFVLVVTLGSSFIFDFWTAVGGSAGVLRPDGTFDRRSGPPEALVYLNPYFAQADVLCAVENGFGTYCDDISKVTNRSPFGGVPVPVGPGFDPAFRGGVVVNDWDKIVALDIGGAPRDVIVGPQPDQLASVRDRLWPQSVAAWLVASVFFILGSVQLVSPTRRWRPRVPGILRRPARRSTP